MEHTLFNQQDASSTFDHYLQEMKTEINSKSNDYVLNVDVEQWRTYFVDKYDFIPLTVYPEKATCNFIGKGKARREQFGREFDVETYRFNVDMYLQRSWHFIFHEILNAQTFRMKNTLQATKCKKYAWLMLRQTSERSFNDA